MFTRRRKNELQGQIVWSSGFNFRLSLKKFFVCISVSAAFQGYEHQALIKGCNYDLKNQKSYIFKNFKAFRNMITRIFRNLPITKLKNFPEENFFRETSTFKICSA